jgi:hypothetical protein
VEAVARTVRCALVVLLAVGTCGMVPIHADDSENFEVVVRLRVDPSITSRVIPDIIKDETARLWRPYGVQIRWADAQSAAPATNGFSLKAIVEPRIDAMPLPNWGASVLGRAAVNLDAPSRRPILVSLDATERVLTTGTGVRASLIRFARETVLARALGRVLAHEMGHVLLGAPYHDDAGLMRAVFRPDELADPDSSPFRLTCTGFGRLRSRFHVLTGTAQPRQQWTADEPLEESDGIVADAFSRSSCIAGHPVR